MKTVLIFGSSRRNGNSGRIADYIIEHYNVDIIDLNEKNIGYFNYDNANEDDDFLPTINTILDYDHLIFISPVYWYSMSAIMKTFFDRITDLMRWHKDTGRQLRGKTMSAISNGYRDMNPETFYPAFEKTAGYLGMDYKGSIHTFAENGVISDDVKQRIASLFE